MQCPHVPEMEQKEFADKLLTGERRPYGGMLEITQRCSNRCRHCYVPPEQMCAEGDALSTDFLLRLLDVLVEEECIWLSFTGGEPLIREDFPLLYEAAKRKGFVISVFTNATLITEEIADLFYELPPRIVSVSLYGSTAEVYENVSRVPGSFEAAMAGVRRLKERDLPAHVKTMMLRSNYHDMANLRALAEELGWSFHFDTGVNPRLDGSTSVLRERLEPEVAASIDTATEERREQWREHYERHGQSDSPRLYTCGAGRRSFAVDAFGGLLPCIIDRTQRWQLDEEDMSGSFKKVFYEEMPRVLAQEIEGDFPCGHCPVGVLCPTCVGWRSMEVEDATLPVKWGCQVAMARARILGLEDVSCPGLG